MEKCYTRHSVTLLSRMWRWFKDLWSPSMLPICLSQCHYFLCSGTWSIHLGSVKTCNSSCSYFFKPGHIVTLGQKGSQKYSFSPLFAMLLSQCHSTVWIMTMVLRNMTKKWKSVTHVTVSHLCLRCDIGIKTYDHLLAFFVV